MKTRAEILDEAKRLVTVDRAATHGGAEDSFGLIAKFWSDYLGIPISTVDVAAMEILLKLARIRGNAGHIDSWVDVAGYGALGGEIAGLIHHPAVAVGR